MLPAGAWAITVINAFNRLGSVVANPLKVDISTKLRAGVRRSREPSGSAAASAAAGRRGLMAWPVTRHAAIVRE